MKRNKASANAIVAHFERAHDAYLFRGCGHPDNYDEFEARYKAARNRLVDYLVNTEA